MRNKKQMGISIAIGSTLGLGLVVLGLNNQTPITTVEPTQKQEVVLIKETTIINVETPTVSENPSQLELLSNPQETETIIEKEAESTTEVETTINYEEETEEEIMETETEFVKVEETTEYEEEYVQHEYDGLYERFSEYEINMMCRCIETEVFECSFEQKVNIANVIFNRLKSDEFPNDVVSIITSPKQFAYFRTYINSDTIEALEYAYANGDTTNGTIGFRSDIAPYEWNGWYYQFSDGVHNFYK